MPDTGGKTGKYPYCKRFRKAHARGRRTESADGKPAGESTTVTKSMAYSYRDNGERRRVLAGVQRVVIKVGTRLLTDMGATSKGERVNQLVRAIRALRARGIEVILVSSGAIGAGMSVLETRKRPRSVSMLQAHAAVGQSRLMYLYETACSEYGFHCGQLLLTAADLQHRERHLNVTNCLDALLAKNVLPIINENDSVSVEEIRVGDNDILAAMVSSMLRADLTVLLTTVNGMYEREPDGRTGRRLSVIEAVTPALCKMAGGTDGNRFSVGGMRTKLRAAELVTRAGENLWIADGGDFAVLEDIFAGKDVGSLFLSSSPTRMKARKRFLAFFSEPTGRIVVDNGAELALREHGRSLLPGGIVGTDGTFERGDTVCVVNREGDEIGRGVTNYSRSEVEKIRGAQSAAIRELLGEEVCFAEVIHRDRLVLTQ